jgi:DNA replication and repair protein RecF
MHGEDFFVIDSRFEMDGEESRVYCGVKRGGKKSFKKDKKEYQRLIDHVGAYPVVIISPYDDDLIREGSDMRRKFIDLIISQDDKAYLEALVNYKKTLSHRNNLLKYFWENRLRDDEQLAIWDERLVEFGAILHAGRMKFIEQFGPIFREFYGQISGWKEKVNLVYRSQLNDADFSNLLKAGVEKDMSRCYTLTGPHKDDILFEIEGHPVKKFGSQGQQKSFLIALKLAQFEYIREHKQLKPLLLLDDVFDKIDDLRVKYLMELVSKNTFGQIFITDTSEERLNRVLEGVDCEFKNFTITTEIPEHEQAEV